MDQMENNEGFIDKTLKMKNLTVMELLRSLWRYKLIIIPAVIIGAIIGYALSVMYYNNVKDIVSYSVQTSLILESKRGDDYVAGGNEVSVSDFSIAKQLVDQTKFLLTSDRTLESLIESTGVQTSAGALKGAITVNSHEETQILIITLRWQKADDALLLINEIAKVLPNEMEETLGMGTVKVIDPGTRVSSSSPRINYNYVMYGTAGGFLISVFIAILLGMLRPTIYNRSEIKQYFALDTLGEIPFHSGVDTTKYLLTTNPDAPFEFVEAYRMFTSIFKHTMDTKGYKTVYVTSSMASEGKTAVITNLAVTLASFERKKVLLVDFDTRKPKVRSALGIERDACNINNVYKGEITFKEAIISINEYLDVVYAESEDESLISNEIITQINDVKDKYDFVLFDTPPIGIVADSVLLNSCVDTAIFVMKYDFVTIDIVSGVVNKIRQSGIDFVGCVLNNIKESRISHYYTSRYYNKYGYYSYGYNKKRSYGYGRSKAKKDKNAKVSEGAGRQDNKNAIGKWDIEDKK